MICYVPELLQPSHYARLYNFVRKCALALCNRPEIFLFVWPGVYSSGQRQSRLPINAICLLLVIAIVIPTHLSAQTVSHVDTLSLAKSLAYEKRFAEADSILVEYGKHHPDNRYVLQLHAIVFYWMNEFNRARTMYEYGIRLFPDFQDLKLDYARMLLETGYYEHAEELLLRYIVEDSASAEANIMLGTLAYWTGDIDAALSYLDTVLQLYPGNPKALDLWNQILSERSPYIRLTSSYNTDDQPLESANMLITSGFVQSSLLQPDIVVRSHIMHANGEQQYPLGIRFGNTFRLGVLGSSLYAATGVNGHANNQDQIRGSYMAHLHVKPLTSIWVDLIAERLPYLDTKRSMMSLHMFSNYRASFSWDLPAQWTGRAEYSARQYDMITHVDSWSFWMLSPPLNLGMLGLRLGYGFSNANSNTNSFVSERSLQEIIDDRAFDQAIAGVYDPYFTPSHQTVHSLVITAQMTFSNRINFKARAARGIKASADHPILSLDIQPERGLFISRSFEKGSFTSVDIETRLSVRVSDLFTIASSYSYFRSYFYNLHTAGLHVALNFYKTRTW